MSTATAPKTSKQSAQAGRLPPEEKFWQRYSPHQEMPLSTICSFALHAFIIGALILAAWLGWFGFGKTPSLPVEVVKFAIPGGGGGNPNGVGNGPGIGSGPEAVQTNENPDPAQPPAENDPMRPTLDKSKIALAPTDVQKDDSFKRYVAAQNPNSGIFGTIEKSVMDKLRDGLNPGKGRGGPGEGGGKGIGKGPGDGAGTGDGPKGALTQREKRMLRWSMIFDTRTGMDYLSQLRGLGAILAIPSGPDGKDYKIVRNLHPPAKLLDEDISKINRIFWVDDRPESVRSLMGALNYHQAPTHFVAFMPLELEQELFELEKKFAGRSEDQIDSTTFRVVRSGNRYKPVVSAQKGR